MNLRQLSWYSLLRQAFAGAGNVQCARRPEPNTAVHEDFGTSVTDLDAAQSVRRACVSRLSM